MPLDVLFLSSVLVLVLVSSRLALVGLLHLSLCLFLCVMQYFTSPAISRFRLICFVPFSSRLASSRLVSFFFRLVLVLSKVPFR